VIHLRLVVPADRSEAALALLERVPSVCNVISLPGVARRPEGDVILCDVAREDVSVVIDDLKRLGVERVGSIALEHIDTQLSAAADRAVEAAPGYPGDAVVWEEVEARTSESTELSVSFLLFMVLAMLIAMVAIMLDSTILIIGAMVVGPEFGPIAGICVAAIQHRADLARRSVAALGVGLAVGIVAVLLGALALRVLSLPPDAFESGERRFTEFISHPDEFSFIVAFLAGMAGVLSLTAAKSSAIIGVLISVTTMPAAANMGLATAYGDWSELAGAAEQLGVNLTGIGIAGIGTLWVQRRFYERRAGRGRWRRRSSAASASS
jgi:uncharacterized hydrophobic protein (TIGR00271 family)